MNGHFKYHGIVCHVVETDESQTTTYSTVGGDTMTTDYNLPTWFWDADTTDEDRHIWMTQDRCRRQALRQDTPYARAVRKQIKREQRRQQARSETVNVADYC